MRLLGIYNSKNKRFRKDGDEFAREALNWMIEAEGPDDIANLVDVTDGRVRAEIRKITNGLDVLAIFDHGAPKGLPRMRENLGNVGGLAATIAEVTDKITIILYSCSCGRGWWGKFGFRWLNKRNKRDMKTPADSYSPRDGYAVALCCELEKLGVAAQVFAHLTRGHTTKNPNLVTVYEWGQIRRRQPVIRSKFTRAEWKKYLRGPGRFTFWR